jgi:hypothetical protein
VHLTSRARYRRHALSRSPFAVVEYLRTPGRRDCHKKHKKAQKGGSHSCGFSCFLWPTSIIGRNKREEGRQKMAWESINQVCDVVTSMSFAIHKYHRNGHLEKIYENALVNRLRKQGLKDRTRLQQDTRSHPATTPPLGTARQRLGSCPVDSPFASPYNPFSA